LSFGQSILAPVLALDYREADELGLAAAVPAIRDAVLVVERGWHSLLRARSAFLPIREDGANSMVRIELEDLAE
jgi:hypothetical protein